MQLKKDRFSLNHIVCPSMSTFEFIEYAAKLGVGAVELGNNINKNSLTCFKAARSICKKSTDNGIEIISINSLYMFNIWNEKRATQAKELAKLANAYGAKGLVLCPMNEAGYQITNEEKLTKLKEALSAIKDILEKYNLKGFVKPLGFPDSSLRFKADAIEIIMELDAEKVFSVVHDTFHHRRAGESEIFPQNTGLMHISGVEDDSITFKEMNDAHRVLIGPKDRIGNVYQLAQMQAAGYRGFISFKPFSQEVLNLDDPMAAVQKSIEYIQTWIRTMR